jgi:hypothetical protein
MTKPRARVARTAKHPRKPTKPAAPSTETIRRVPDDLRIDTATIPEDDRYGFCRQLYWQVAVYAGILMIQSPRVAQRMARLVDIAIEKSDSPLGQLILELTDRLYECKPEELDCVGFSWKTMGNRDHCLAQLPRRLGAAKHGRAAKSKKEATK